MSVAAICRKCRVLGIAFAVATLLPGSARGASIVQDTNYREVSLADLVRAPGVFDESFVRVRGLCHLYYESTTISIAPEGQTSGDAREMLWLDVGWPLAPELAAMNNEVVVVEARFDVKRNGYYGQYRGTLTDIRAIWPSGRDSDAYVLNYETRADALQQLRFKTGWLMVGTRVRNGYRWGNQKNNGWIETWFEFISPPTIPDDKRLPRKGDRIRLTERLRIHITGYATSGEQRRVDPPMASGRSRAQGDETRLWLASGAVVRVANVQVSRRNFGVVWVRVVPAHD